MKSRWFVTMLLLVLLSLFAGRVLFTPAHAQSVEVQVEDNYFNPEPITIPPGTTLVWTNVGKVAHTVTSDDSSTEKFDSNILPPGKSFSYTFNHEGVFTYHCTIHEEMLGTVIVQDPAAATATVLALTPTAMPAPTKTPVSAHRAPHTILTKTVGVGFGFTAKTLTIKVGAKVTWENQSTVLHTVTSRSKNWKFNKKLKPHGKLSFTFRQPGTYSYYCIYHAGMVGKIIVHK